jgi:hypothetical protein
MDERQLAIQQSQKRAAAAQKATGERVGFRSTFKFSDTIRQPQLQGDGSFVFPKSYTTQQILDFQKDNFFLVWEQNRKRGAETANNKFGKSPEKITSDSFMPVKQAPLPQYKIYDARNQYAQEPFAYGFNEELKKLAIEYGVAEWKKQYTEAFNQMVQTYGNDAEKLYTEAAYLPNDTPNPYKLMKDLWFEIKEPNNSKYARSPTNAGHNDALAELYKAIPPPPPPKSMDWTDYFFEGLTMPFKVVSEVAPHLIGL